MKKLLAASLLTIAGITFTGGLVKACPYPSPTDPRNEACSSTTTAAPTTSTTVPATTTTVTLPNETPPRTPPTSTTTTLEPEPSFPVSSDVEPTPTTIAPSTTVRLTLPETGPKEDLRENILTVGLLLAAVIGPGALILARRRS